jgi:uncharacterized NAD-dependent epimerase/dehydratase family protein
MRVGLPEGSAIVFCEGAFGTPNGKTAHGLIRRTRRYRILSVIDSTQAHKDAGEALEGKANGIPIYSCLQEALDAAKKAGQKPTYLVIGLAPDGGRLNKRHREAIKEAINAGLHIDSGLHDFLSEDPEFQRLAAQKGVRLRDVRKTPPRNELHFFSGKIDEVTSLKIAVLGTDSAVGKRTTAWMLIEALSQNSYTAELIGTGQTAWMQGADYTIMLDSLINDFVSGEIEHAVWSAWNEKHPDAIVIEGQGSLLNPAYPGGFEILAAGRPDVIILQHAPARREYDGFPGYPLHPLEIQIQALELISGKPVVAVTINHENISLEKIPEICALIHRQTGLPAFDVLLSGAAEIIPVLQPYFIKRSPSGKGFSHEKR